MNEPVIVGITGASGAVLGVRLLEMLRDLAVEAHAIVTEPGVAVLAHETGLTLGQLGSMAARLWPIDDLFSLPASGSFRTAGMVIAPCSIRTLSAVATSRSSNLLERAADVTLKERRPLIMMVRESPLHLGHLRLMVAATEMGATIVPPVPAFYEKPQSVEELVDQSVGKSLDLLGLDHPAFQRWQGA